jgi:hypothetical protein
MGKFKMKGFNPGQGTGMAKNLAAKAGKSRNLAAKAGESTAKSISHLAEMVTEKMLNRTIKQNLKKKTAEYTPQTKSRKDISTDITPQTRTTSPMKKAGDISKRKRIIKEKEIDPETGGTITYKKKYRKSGELKKYKIRDPKAKAGEKYSKFKKDKAGNIKDGEHHPSGLFKMNGKQDKKVPAIPTKEEGSDAWRANFLKRHKVTNDQVNNEIYKIGGGEDDVDFDDWKRVVLSLSKNKKAHQADWEPEFMGGDN